MENFFANQLYWNKFISQLLGVLALFLKTEDTINSDTLTRHAPLVIVLWNKQYYVEIARNIVFS